jgi:hypothetical protein
LESRLSSVASNPYALNIICYALTLAGSSEAEHASQLLDALAITEGNNGYIAYTV